MADVDRSRQYLKVLKGADVMFVGAIGTGSVDITGLAAETVVKVGDYKVVFDVDSNKSLSSAASDPADVPAFTVPAAAK